VAVVAVDPGRDRGPGIGPADEPLEGAHSSNSRVEYQDSTTALSSADPARPIDCRIPSGCRRCRTGARSTRFPVCQALLAWSSVFDHVPVLGAVKVIQPWVAPPPGQLSLIST
jgi:hypothetical protein